VFGALPGEVWRVLVDCRLLEAASSGHPPDMREALQPCADAGETVLDSLTDKCHRSMIRDTSIARHLPTPRCFRSSHITL
jgi:hypothetical protein